MLRLGRELSLAALRLDHPRPSAFVTAQCCSRSFYGCWRAFWAVYHATWVLLSWVLDPWATRAPAERVKWFVYLTNWTYLLLAVESVLEAINFFLVHALRVDIVKGVGTVRMPWYLKLQWLMYNIVTTGSLMVTAWYWTFLYKSEKELGAVRLSLHAFNSVYVVLNLLVTATPTRLLHAVHPVLFGVAYTLFSAVFQLAGGKNIDGEPYIYRMTDWRQPWKALLISSISNFLAIPLVHVLVFLLRLACTRIWKRHNCYCCGRSSTDAAERDEFIAENDREARPLGGAVAEGGDATKRPETIGGLRELRRMSGVGEKEGGGGLGLVHGCIESRTHSVSSQGAPLVLSWDDVTS